MTYVLTSEQRELAVQLLGEGVVTVPDLARKLKVTRQSLLQLAERRGLRELSKIRARYVRRLWEEAMEEVRAEGNSGRSA